ncbi:hypothetical protein ACFQ0G_02770 [Streptomyces chiangmaiensis]
MVSLNRRLNRGGHDPQALIEATMAKAAEVAQEFPVFVHVWPSPPPPTTPPHPNRPSNAASAPSSPDSKARFPYSCGHVSSVGN